MADIDAARFDVEGARAAIAAEVARALFQSRGLKVQRDEALETLRIQNDLFGVVTERARRGLAASSEADRVAADLAQAEAQVEDLGAALTASRRALLVVVGSGTAALGDDDEVLASLDAVPEVPVAMPGDLLSRRPDVRMAASRVRRAASNVRLAELDFFPRFTLNPGLGISAQRGTIDSTTGFWSLAAGLTVPVLDRPRLQAQLDAEGARTEQSVLAYERTVQTAFSEADQSLTRLQADRRRVTTLTARRDPRPQRLRGCTAALRTGLCQPAGTARRRARLARDAFRTHHAQDWMRCSARCRSSRPSAAAGMPRLERPIHSSHRQDRKADQDEHQIKPPMGLAAGCGAGPDGRVLEEARSARSRHRIQRRPHRQRHDRGAAADGRHPHGLRSAGAA